MLANLPSGQKQHTPNPHPLLPRQIHPMLPRRLIRVRIVYHHRFPFFESGAGDFEAFVARFEEVLVYADVRGEVRVVVG